MSGMDRSLIFTYLLEYSEEFRVMQSNRGTRLITDAQDRLDADREATPGVTVAQSMKGYLHDITLDGATESGVLERYVDSLLAGDARRAAALGVSGLPQGIHVVEPLRGSSHN